MNTKNYLQFVFAVAVIFLLGFTACDSDDGGKKAVPSAITYYNHNNYSYTHYFNYDESGRLLNIEGIGYPTSFKYGDNGQLRGICLEGYLSNCPIYLNCDYNNESYAYKYDSGRLIDKFLMNEKGFPASDSGINPDTGESYIRDFEFDKYNNLVKFDSQIIDNENGISYTRNLSKEYSSNHSPFRNAGLSPWYYVDITLFPSSLYRLFEASGTLHIASSFAIEKIYKRSDAKENERKDVKVKIEKHQNGYPAEIILIETYCHTVNSEVIRDWTETHSYTIDYMEVK